MGSNVGGKPSVHSRGKETQGRRRPSEQESLAGEGLGNLLSGSSKEEKGKKTNEDSLREVVKKKPGAASAPLR